MGLTKTIAFAAAQNRLADLFKALGHPARLAIVQHLAQQPGCQCGDLVDVLPLSQSTVSQHLAALKAAGILQGEVTGPRICYCLNPAVLQELQAALTLLQLTLDNPSQTNCC